MNIVRVEENENPNNYIIVTQQTDINETITNNVFVTEDLNKSVNIVEISRGLRGFDGMPGKDGVVFDILPIISGGTNNTNYTPNKILYYDGSKLVSSNYDISDIITGGVVGGTGIITVVSGNHIIVNSNLGSGLYVDSNNHIVVDFNAIDSRVMEKIDIVAGSGLFFHNNSYHVGGSSDIVVNTDNISLSVTGTPGEYTKVVTDSKGRVVSGSVLSVQDITNALGFTPYHQGNDGPGSLLNADMLDNQNGDFYLNAGNLTGTLPVFVIPKFIDQGSYTKVHFSNDGIITGVSNNIYSEITGSLGFTPISQNAQLNSIIVNGSIFSGNIIRLYDNLPIFANNHSNIPYSEPRGFRFLYGDSPISPKTGLLAYYHTDKKIRLITDTSDVILTNSLASQMYASLSNTNSFSGINNFLQTTYLNLINISGLNINSTGLIINLNSDYLDSNHGSYYLNARNLTGILNASGYPVVVTNISGTSSRIALFDNRTTNPSRTITNSILSQVSGNIIVNDDGNLLVGDSNIAISGLTQNSLLVGTTNKMTDAINSVVFGSEHIMSGHNSLAANFKNTVMHNSSAVFGQQGKTWADSQMVFGIFEEPTGLNSGQGQGQHAVTTFYYYGQAQDIVNMIRDDWPIPKNKTLLYDAEILITKLGGSGCAAFKFESGIMRNITRRKPNNLAVEENFTYIVNPASKSILYNNSYLRDYVLYLSTSTSNSGHIVGTNIRVVDSPALEEPTYSKILNLPKFFVLDPKPISLTGNFIYDEKDDYITFNCDKPRTNGFYVQKQSEYELTVYSYKHNAVTGCELSINFNDPLKNYTGGFVVTSIIDEHTAKVSLPLDDADISVLNMYDNSMTLNINTNKNNYSGVDTLYVKYQNNNFIYSDYYSNFNFNDNTTVTISDLNPNFLAYSNCLSNYGKVGICPASTNSGHCTIVGKRQLSGTYNITAPNPPTTYPFNKFLYVQSPSDANGHSVVTLTNEDGAWWPDLSGSLQNSDVYIQFAQYFDTSYTSVDSPGTGIELDIPFSSIDYNISGQTSNRDTDIPLFIFKINNQPQSLYVTTSGGIDNRNSHVFIPMNTGSLPSSGTITIIDSGLYNNGNHPINNRFRACSIDNTLQQFTTQTTYYPPHSGYLSSGYIHVYYSGISVPFMINNIVPNFYSNNNEKAYLYNNANLAGNYDVTTTNFTTFGGFKQYFYPETIPNSNSIISICIDANHGLIPDTLSTSSPATGIYSYVPIQMTGSAGGPDNGLYFVESVDGDSFKVNNSKTTLRNNNAKTKMYLGLYSWAHATGIVGSFNYKTHTLGGSGLWFTDPISISELSLSGIINVHFSPSTYFIVVDTTESGVFAVPLNNYLTMSTGYPCCLHGLCPSLPNNTISYSKVFSGVFNIPQNNLYFDTDMSDNVLYNRWGFDSDNNAIRAPILCRYTIGAFNTTCEPEQCCITLQSEYNQLLNIKEKDNIYISFDKPIQTLSSGYIVHKSNNSDSITTRVRLDILNDMNQSDLILPISGFAEVIPHITKNYNSSKDPNYNNSFFKPEVTTTSGLDNFSIEYLQLFDHRTKRQIHSLILDPKFKIDADGYKSTGFIPSPINENNISINNDETTQPIYCINKSIQPLQISNISWKYKNITDGWDYPSGVNTYVPVENSLINIYNDVSWTMKIEIIEGVYFTGYKPMAPAISIFGVKNYRVYNPVYSGIANTNAGIWTVDIDCDPISQITNKPIRITAQDLVSQTQKNITLNSYERISTININQPCYGITNTPWYHFFNLKGVNPNEIGNISIDIDEGSVANYRWEPQLNCFSILTSGLTKNQPLPYYANYVITYGPQKLRQSGLVVPTGDLPLTISTIISNEPNPVVFYPTCNTYFISFIVPNTNNNINDLTFYPLGSQLSFHSSAVSYDPYRKRYLVETQVNTNTDAGLYSGVFTFIDSGNNVIQTIYKDIIIANDLSIDLNKVYPESFDFNDMWSTSFHVRGGIGSFNSKYSPFVKIDNLPIIGFYNKNSSDEYVLVSADQGISYNDNLNTQVVSVTGIRTFYDNNYFRNTGVSHLDIYVDDGYSSISGRLPYTIQNLNKISNLGSPIYAKYNDSYAFTVESNTSNVVKNNNSIIDSQINVLSKKYDTRSQTYVYRVSGSAIDEIYDANIELLPGTNYETVNLSKDSIVAKCRGILDDSIYAVAKLSTLEVSNSYINVPIRISNLATITTVQPEIGWNITFNTCYGLENSGYPPNIVLIGTPTPCSGAAPDMFPDTSNPNICIKTKTFNPTTKCWSFSFSGPPLCDITPPYTVSVIAQDIADGAIISSDNGETTLDYPALESHPMPTFDFGTTDDSINYPACSNISIPWSGFVNNRTLCPSPTGLRTLVFSGILPSGLQITNITTTPPLNTMPQPEIIDGQTIYTFNSASNITMVRGDIQGTMTEFLSEQRLLKGSVTDYRLGLGIDTQPFQDDSEAVDYPIRHTTVYFSDRNYATGTIESFNQIRVWSPPIGEEGFEYTGRFKEKNSHFSGVYFVSDSLKQEVTISGLNKSIVSPGSPGDQGGRRIIYAKFDDQPASTMGLYEATYEHNLDPTESLLKITSTIISTPFANRKSCIFTIPDLINQTSDGDPFAGFNGKPDVSLISVNGKLLGRGTFAKNPSVNIYGPKRPSYEAFVTDLGDETFYPDNPSTMNAMLFHKHLTILPLDGVCCDHAQNALVYKNCYETCITRISGIIVPKPFLEWTDSTKLVYRNQSVSKAIRMAYGYNNNSRSRIENQRPVGDDVFGALYCIGEEDAFVKFVANDLVSIQPPDSKNGTMLHQYVLPSGCIIKLLLYRQGDNFPTSNQFAIPYVFNTYYYMYANYTKSENQNILVNDRKSFAPYVPIELSDSLYIDHNEPFYLNGKLIGGFIPDSNNVLNSNNTDAITNTAHYENFPPICTGILYEPLYRWHDAEYEIVGNTGILIKLQHSSGITNVFDVDDYIYIKNISGTLNNGFPQVFNTGLRILGTGLYNSEPPYRISGNLEHITSLYALDPQISVASCVFFTKNSNNTSIDITNIDALNINDLCSIESPDGIYPHSAYLLTYSGDLSVSSKNSSSTTLSSTINGIFSNYPSNGFGLMSKKLSGVSTELPISLSYGEIGRFNLSISGNSVSAPGLFSNPATEYRYQIITHDNADLPVLDEYNWSRYLFNYFYDLYIVKPIEVRMDPTGNPVEEINISGSNTNWSTTFYISYGRKPLRKNIPLIEVNNNYVLYTATYISEFDMLKIEIKDINDVSLNPTPCIKIDGQEYNTQVIL